MYRIRNRPWTENPRAYWLDKLSSMGFTNPVDEFNKRVKRGLLVKV